MYATSLPLYYELVISSDDGADGNVDSGAGQAPQALAPG